MATIFITAQTVAELTGFRSAAAFNAQRARLTEDEAFPLPMPTRRRPVLWKRDEVEAWVDRQGLPPAPRLVIPEGTNVRLLQLARTA